jgi:hypothetical protein
MAKIKSIQRTRKLEIFKIIKLKLLLGLITMSSRRTGGEEVKFQASSTPHGEWTRYLLRIGLNMVKEQYYGL